MRSIFMNLMPKQVANHFDRWFDCKRSEVFCQLASQLNAKPYIRTMRLYAVNHDGSLEFLSYMDTQKWSDWQKNPNVAGCFLNLNFGQILVEGNVTLKTTTTHPIEAKNIDSLPRNTQMIYMREETKNVPESFGIINIMPNLWEILELSEPYYLSSRMLYRLVDGIWHEEKLQIKS